MTKYILFKLGQGVLMILTVSLLIFSLLYMMPGDPVEIMTGERVPEERKDEIRARFGLDKPLVVQFVNWLGKVARFDFGQSLITKIPVVDSLRSRIPVTIRLSGLALIVQLVVAIPLGLLAAYKKDGLVDRTLMAISSFLQSTPNFWMAMLLILLFGATLKWLPLNGIGTWKHDVLPIFSLSLGGIASFMRMTKAEVLENFKEKYVQTAYAKGLGKRDVIVKHVLRNSLILVVTMLCMQIPWIVSGAVIIENIFVIPGMGSFLTRAISQQDFPIVQSCILIISVLTVLCNMISDMLAAVLDPRIRIELSGGAG